MLFLLLSFLLAVSFLFRFNTTNYTGLFIDLNELGCYGQNRLQLIFRLNRNFNQSAGK